MTTVGATTDRAPLRQSYAETRTRHVANNDIRYSYREAGDGNIPLVLLQHLRGNLDNWDPALIDGLAVRQRVVTFNSVGVASTTGETSNTVEAVAQGAIEFIDSIHSSTSTSSASLWAASSPKRSLSFAPNYRGDDPCVISAARCCRH